MKTLKQMTTEELMAELRAGLGTVAEGYLRAAHAWVELVNRGVDLSKWTTPLLTFLPDVAAGRLLPEVMVVYGGEPNILRHAATVVPEDQRKLVNPLFTVEVLQPSGAVVKKKPTQLTRGEAAQVFGSDRIRNPIEQKPYVAPVRVKPKPKAAATTDRAEFDLWTALAPAQRKALADAADKRGFGQTPVAFVVDLLLQSGVIPATTPVRSHQRTVRENRAAL